MNRIVPAALIVALLLVPTASGCVPGQEAQQIEPPFYSVTVATADGKGLVTLALLPFDDSFSAEEIQEIQDNLQAMLGAAIYQPEGPQVASTPPVFAEGSRVVAFGYAVYTDGLPSPYWGIAGNEGAVEAIYQKAEEWFFRELEGKKHP